MSFNLASIRLTSSLGPRTGFPAIARLAAYRTPTRRNMTTEIFGRKIEKRFLYTVLTVLGTAEGYFYYSTYYKSKNSSSSEQKTNTENKASNNN